MRALFSRLLRLFLPAYAAEWDEPGIYKVLRRCGVSRGTRGGLEW